MQTRLWPIHLLTSEAEATCLIARALKAEPLLKVDGLDGSGLDIHGVPEAVAVCNDFLLGVRPRKSVDDRRTSVEIAAVVAAWSSGRVAVPHGALIAAAIANGFTYRRYGLSACFNMRWRDVMQRRQF